MTSNWKNLGIVLLGLLILGMFDKTRTLAIWLAIIISILIIAKKYSNA